MECLLILTMIYVYAWSKYNLLPHHMEIKIQVYNYTFNQYARYENVMLFTIVNECDLVQLIALSWPNWLYQNPNQEVMS